MSTRRDFLKVSMIASAAAASSTIPSLVSANTPAMLGIVYTKDNPGKWAKKVGGHAPIIKQEGQKVTVTTKHSMSNEHFIVRHTLVLDDGTVVGTKTFSPSDSLAESMFELPKGYTSKFFATSFCNLHDFWLTESV